MHNMHDTGSATIAKFHTVIATMLGSLTPSAITVTAPWKVQA